MSQDKGSSQEYLHFEAPVQEAIAGWMLTDYSFFLKCKSHMDFTYFRDPQVSDIVRLIYQAHDTYGRQPIKGDIETMLNVSRYTTEESKIKFAVLNRCMISRESHSLDVLAGQMNGWKKLILFRRDMGKAETLYNSGRWMEALGWLKEELSNIDGVNFEKEDKIMFNDTVDFYSNRNRDSHRNRCTLGHPYFDELVHSNSAKPQTEWTTNDIRTQTYGSLVPGSTTMLIGPSNAGKTTTVVTMLFYNLMFERKVLLITLEEKWEDMKHYINQCIVGVEGQAFNKIDGNPDLQARISGIDRLTRDKLVYIDGVKLGKMYIEDIASIIEIEQEKMKNVRASERQKERQRLRASGRLDSQMEDEFALQEKENRGFDLVIVDYPGKLKSKSMGKNSSLHEEQAYVYNKFVELSLIHRFHSILPVQTNREGYKAANRKNGNEESVVDQAHIANSFGIAQVASNVITINRGPSDIKANRIKYYIAKSRTAPATGCFVSKTDFSKRRAFGVLGLNAGKILPGHTITDESVCMALGDKAVANAAMDIMPDAKGDSGEQSLQLDEIAQELILKSALEENIK